MSTTSLKVCSRTLNHFSLPQTLHAFSHGGLKRTVHSEDKQCEGAGPKINICQVPNVKPVLVSIWNGVVSWPVTFSWILFLTMQCC